MEEFHGFRDAVEGQNTDTVIQVHSNSGGRTTWALRTIPFVVKECVVSATV